MSKNKKYYNQSVPKESKEYNDRPKFTERVKGFTRNHKDYLNHLRTKDIIFGTGCAGTGKSYMAACIASELLLDKVIDNILITRPVCETGRDLGALPGELSDKFSPFIKPLLSIFEEKLGESFVRLLIKDKRIQIEPLEYMRGKTIKDCFVILDEAQNTTPEQMKMFLTRLGKGSRMAITGDTRQSDLHRINGLYVACSKLVDIDRIGMIEFTLEDMMRHDLVAEIITKWDT